MSEEVARLVGSEGVDTLEIDGKEYAPKPLDLASLGTVERECLKYFKRHFLETYSDNMDLLPENQRESLMMAKMDEIAKWDCRDLPVQLIVDPMSIVISDKLAAWIEAFFNLKLIESKDNDTKAQRNLQIRRMACGAIDQKSLTAEKYRELTGADADYVQVGYVQWWITGNFTGMLALVYQGFKHHNLSREAVAAALMKNPGVLMYLSRSVEDLSSPKVGK